MNKHKALPYSCVFVASQWEETVPIKPVKAIHKMAFCVLDAFGPGSVLPRGAVPINRIAYKYSSSINTDPV